MAQEAAKEKEKLIGIKSLIDGMTLAFSKDILTMSENFYSMLKKNPELASGRVVTDLNEMNRDMLRFNEYVGSSNIKMDKLNVTTSKTIGNMGKKLKSLAADEMSGLVVDTVENAAKTFSTSAFGSKGGSLLSNTLTMGISGLLEGGIPGAILGTGLGLINSAIDNYAADDEQFRSYVSSQFENISKNQGAESKEASLIAASKEPSDEESEFTVISKKINGISEEITRAMGGTYNANMVYGEGGLMEQAAFYTENKDEIKEMKNVVAYADAATEKKKNKYEEDAVEALFSGNIAEEYMGTDFGEQALALSKGYQKAMADFNNAGSEEEKYEAARRVEMYYNSATALAADAYKGSEFSQVDTDIQKELIRNLQHFAAKSNAYEGQAAISEELTKGRLSTITPMMDKFYPSLSNYGNPEMFVRKPESPTRTYNDFMPTLNNGNRVASLDAGQSNKSGVQGVTVTGNNFTVREEADINKVARALFREIEKARITYVYNG